MKMYAWLVKHWYWTACYYTILLAVLFLALSKPPNVLAILVLVGGGVIILGVPSFSIVYFLFTRRNEVILNAVIIDTICMLAFAVVFVVAILRFSFDEHYLYLELLIPIPSLAMKLAYFHNMALMSYLKDRR